MIDLLQGKGQKALFIYKILPFLLLSIGIFFINAQEARFVFIGFFMIASIAFVLIYPIKAYIKGDKLFYKKTFGSEKSIDLSTIKYLIPEYRKKWGWCYTIAVKYESNQKLKRIDILGLTEKNRGFMRNINDLPPFYISEELKKAIKQQSI
ncbi:hypothetical protein [Flavobacterium phragmitis]|uniref:Uncharacterized protein n=1 Tax=Flavobacterium phragmitis TaxID=739143 RepID=A0A1I1S3J9_9FLAO|nr:hypothetical protein [Flavobacterium phragmitis]SFD39118.1 hypothetical protein SAMN05216297_107215 [Flavobacterium phragmitis]